MLLRRRAEALGAGGSRRAFPNLATKVTLPKRRSKRRSPTVAAYLSRLKSWVGSSETIP